MSERLVLSVDDLTGHDIDTVLQRAAQFASKEARPRSAPVVALIFLTASTRTRLGFAAAAARLGGCPVDLAELRYDASMSASESFLDTIRVVSGTVDAVVFRTKGDVDRTQLSAAARSVIISGGHGDREHPTQALVDVAAMEHNRMSLTDQRVTICGDLGMRAVRSLLGLLGRRPPQELILVGPPDRDDVDDAIPRSLHPLVRRVAPEEMPETDILYLPGLPERRGDSVIAAPERRRYAATSEMMRRLAPDGVLLSPLPFVDEIDDDVRQDPRMRAFEQSDHGVFVRMALLEQLTAGSTRG